MSTLAAIGALAPIALVSTLALRASLGVDPGALGKCVSVVFKVRRSGFFSLLIGALRSLGGSWTRPLVMSLLVAVAAGDRSVVVSHDFLALLKKVNVYLITLTVYHRDKGGVKVNVVK
jgi:hypothetical protein